MSGRARMRVMIVVPAFAKCQQRHPPTVGRIVVRNKAARAPQMRRRINQPGEMEANSHAQKRRRRAFPSHRKPAAQFRTRINGTKYSRFIQT